MSSFVILVGLFIILLFITIFFIIFRKKSYQDNDSQSFKNTDTIIDLTKKLAASEATLYEKISQLSLQKTQIDETKKHLQDANFEITNLKSEISKNKVLIEERENNLTSLKSQFEVQKNNLKEEFENLSQKILKNKAQDLSKQNQENIGFLLKPLEEQIKSFKERINTVHDVQTKGSAKLEQQINKLAEMNNNLKNEAENLALALKNNKKTLGDWGEIQIERLLEDAGLQKGREYKREDVHRNDEGKIGKPDFVVYLPEHKHIIIDSKVSLNNYVNSVNATDSKKSTQEIKKHVQCVADHIDTLANRNYTKLIGIDSPDFVFMFMPMETAYLAALDADSSLFQKAYQRKIAIVTPNTLLPILRTVASLWAIDKQNKSTKELGKHATKIYEKLGIFAEKFTKIEERLNLVNKSYDEARTTLTGKGGLVRLASGFRELGVYVNKDLPQKLLEENQLTEDLKYNDEQ